MKNLFKDEQDLNNLRLVSDIKKQCLSNRKYIQLYENQGFSLINMALLMGELEFADWLTNNGAVINTVNDGGTPLSCACFKGTPSLIKQIFSKTNEEYIAKSSPLSQAIYSAKKGNLETVLSLGFSINLPDNYGDTPLTTAIYAIETLGDEYREPGITLRKQLKLIEFIIEKGATIGVSETRAITHLNDIQSTSDYSLLCLMYDYKMFFLTKLFITHGINVTFQNKEGLNFLNKMIEEEDKEMIEHILENSVIDEFHQATSLQKTCKNEELFARFLEKGFNPNVRLNGDTILHYVIININNKDRLKSVKTLCKYGADLNALNDLGVTPLIISLLVKIETEEKHDKELFDYIMSNQPNLHATKFFSRENIQDIFDLAVTQKRYHWFEPYYEKMSNSDQSLYSSKRLKDLFNEDEPIKVHKTIQF